MFSGGGGMCCELHAGVYVVLGGGNLGEGPTQLLKGWMKTVAEAQNALACGNEVGKAKGCSGSW